MLFANLALQRSLEQEGQLLPKHLIQILLWLASLVFGIHLGSSIYEMVVITPLWAASPPSSVRAFNAVAEYIVQPLTYKVPAVGVLSVVSVALLTVAHRKGPHRIWLVIAGVIGVIVACATVLYAFPLLRSLVGEHGAGLTDALIVDRVDAWLIWSRIRVALLVMAWGATQLALMQRIEPTSFAFRSELRWK